MPWMMLLRASPYIGLALLISALLVQCHRVDAANERADKAETVAAQAQHDLEVEKSLQKEVVKYVDVVKTIDRPVPVIKRVLVDRVCPVAGDRARVPDHAGTPDATTGGTPDDSFADKLSAELPACVRNSERLRSLQAAIRITQKTPQP